MKFMGSKNRHAKHFLPVIFDYAGENRMWVEPFVGGGNVIDKILGRRIGSDADYDVIEALKFIRDHVDEIPKDNSEFTEKDYYDIKKEHTFVGGLRSYVSFALSYSGKKWGGWCRDKEGKRDYVAEAYRNALKQSESLYGCLFFHTSFDELSFPQNSIVYCDPPYMNSTGYKTPHFDHELFWRWCRKASEKGHNVFVSEYNAPKDFTCIWERENVSSSLTKETGSKKAVEKLFTLEY